MKRYQIIAVIALLVIAGTVSAEPANKPEPQAAQLGKVQCPHPTRTNSMFVVEDQDGDGTPDHVWRIYKTGPCVGEFIGKAMVIR